MDQERKDTDLADARDVAQEHANKLFNTGAETDPKNPDNKSKEGGFYNPEGDKLDAGGLGQLETSAGAASGIAGAASAAGAAAGLFSGNEASGFLGRLSLSRRKGITGGIIGLFVAGGVFFGFTAASGPFQFIHLAQLLQQFHMSEQSDESDDRLSKLARYARAVRTGKVEQGRLGHFANNYANTIETDLNKSGITSGYDDAGRFTGYTIDTTNENFKDKTNDQIKEQFKQTYGIDVTTNTVDGKLTVNTQKNGYFAQRKLIGVMLEQAGFKGVTGAIKARTMAKRAGLTLHPIKKLDAKATGSVWALVKKQFTSDVEKGATEQAAKAGVADNTDENATEEQKANDKAAATSATDDTNKVLSDAPAASEGDVKAKASFKAKLGIGAGATAAGVGVACTIKSLNDGAAAKKAETVAQLERFGGTFIALGNQAMYGGQDNPDYINQLGYFSSTYFNSTEPGNTGSWTAGESIQAELGQPRNGVKPDGTLTSLLKGSPLAFINDIPGIGPACSKVGTFVLTAFSFVTGPASFAVGIAVNHALEAAGVFDTVINWLSGKTVNLATTVGPQFGNYANYSALLLANEQALSSAGRALTTQETAQLKAVQTSETNSAFQNQSFAYRIFSPSSPKSIVGTLIDAQNPNVTANTSQVASGFLNMGSSLMSIPAKLFSSVAHAATDDAPYDYGFPTYGFSAAELSDPDVENPYANADYVVNNLLNDSVISAAQSCFNVTVSSDGSSVNAVTNKIINAYDTDNYKSSDCANGSKAGISSHDWLRVRMFIFDSETADAASCYQGDDTSCTNVGFGTTSTSSDTSALTGTPIIATGTAAELAQQLLNNPNYVPLSFSDVKQDLQATAAGQTINNSDTCGNTVSINADLLQVMLTATQKFKIEPINIITGHGCDQFLHPKGRATDIDFVTDLSTGKRTNLSPGTSGDDQAVDRAFYVYIASILPKGGELGQSACAGRTGLTAPPGITFFPDGCNHQHIDLGNTK